MHIFEADPFFKNSRRIFVSYTKPFKPREKRQRLRKHWKEVHDTTLRGEGTSADLGHEFALPVTSTVLKTPIKIFKSYS